MLHGDPLALLAGRQEPGAQLLPRIQVDPLALIPLVGHHVPEGVEAALELPHHLRYEGDVVPASAHHLRCQDDLRFHIGDDADFGESRFLWWNSKSLSWCS